MNGVVNRIRRSQLLPSRAFPRDESGSVAVISALAGLALIGAVGVGIDLMRVSSAKNALTQTADLTCQYARVNMPALGARAGVAAARTYLNTLLTAYGLDSAKVTTTVLPIGATMLSVKLTTNITPNLSSVLGLGLVPVSAGATCYGGGGGGSIVTQILMDFASDSGTCEGDNCYAPNLTGLNGGYIGPGGPQSVISPDTGLPVSNPNLDGGVSFDSDGGAAPSFP